MALYRPQYQILKRRIEAEPKRFIQVLYGPRQVGKSTLVQQLAKNTKLPVHFISADDINPNEQSWLSSQWHQARLKIKNKKEGILIIDEIQKIHNWSETVKKEWDADAKNKIPLKVIVLGSSRLLLQQGLTESLAGRFETTYLGHWSYKEMHKAFGITPEEFVWFGGYPGAASLIKDEQRWKQYILHSIIETSISKDILMLSRVDKPALMKKLFEIGCLYSGQVLSYTKIMGQLHDAGNTTTLAHYLNLLDTAGLLGGLEKYGPNVIKQKSSSPKLLVHNTAMITAQQSLDFKKIKSQPDVWGRWVESAIGAYLLNCSLEQNFKLSYWKQGNFEVDFIIQYMEKVLAIEVKSGNIQKSKSLEVFTKAEKPDKIIIVGDSGIPWQEFLKLDVLELF